MNNNSSYYKYLKYKKKYLNLRQNILIGGNPEELLNQNGNNTIYYDIDNHIKSTNSEDNTSLRIDWSTDPDKDIIHPIPKFIFTYNGKEYTYNLKDTPIGVKVIKLNLLPEVLKMGQNDEDKRKVFNAFKSVWNPLNTHLKSLEGRVQKFMNYGKDTEAKLKEKNRPSQAIYKGMSFIAEFGQIRDDIYDDIINK